MAASRWLAGTQYAGHPRRRRIVEARDTAAGQETHAGLYGDLILPIRIGEPDPAVEQAGRAFSSGFELGTGTVEPKAGGLHGHDATAGATEGSAVASAARCLVESRLVRA